MDWTVMIHKGMIIKHWKFMDVAFIVRRVDGPFGSEGYRVIKGDWVNLGTLQSFNIGISQRIKIIKKNLDQWLYCEDTHLPCLRDSKWSNLK